MQRQIDELINDGIKFNKYQKQLEQLRHDINENNNLYKDNSKALYEKLSSELILSLKDVKKEMALKNKKKDDASLKKAQEKQFAVEKICEEVKTIKDKMSKMALQFDKELSTRDKVIKAN